MRGLLCFEALIRRHLCGDADVNDTTTAGRVAIMSPASACEGSRVRMVCVEVSGPRAALGCR
jgi:hypothetical protein